jgi:small-conductance mechanosensitive channel
VSSALSVPRLYSYNEGKLRLVVVVVAVVVIVVEIVVVVVVQGWLVSRELPRGRETSAVGRRYQKTGEDRN